MTYLRQNKQIEKLKFLLKVIVKATDHGPRCAVGCRRQLEKKTTLKVGARACLDTTTLTIMRYLPREVDPLVHYMSQEGPGDVRRAQIGGLLQSK